MATILKKSSEFIDTLKALGTVGIMLTDTIYGVVARAADEVAVERLYTLKQRDGKPGTIIAASTEQLVSLGIRQRYLTPVAQYWPNPISIVIPIESGLSYLHLGKFSLAVRIPANTELQNILIKTGPLLTSSANLPGEPAARNVSEARSYFGESVDFYLDGGQINNQASTILRIVDDAVEVLREGAVKINENGEIIT